MIISLQQKLYNVAAEREILDVIRIFEFRFVETIPIPMHKNEPQLRTVKRKSI